ncbi:MAG: hypothetical protein CUN55_18710 [Phototrophicales bacterium]|nr:MAG: hypothetical protein CUN55_18710 [Phototrophicales bacterium]
MNRAYEAIMDEQDPAIIAQALVDLLELFQREGGTVRSDEGARVRQLLMRASELTHELEG